MKAYTVRHSEKQWCDFAIEAENMRDALDKFRNLIETNPEYIENLFCAGGVEGEQQVLYIDPSYVTEDCYISDEKYQKLIHISK